LETRGIGGIIARESGSSSGVILQKIIYATIGILAVIAGFVCMVGYAIPALEDFSQANVPFAQRLSGCVLIWALALAAFYMGYRYLRRLL